MEHSQSHVVPCLWFDHLAEQAAAFHIEAFSAGGTGAASGGRVLSRSRYPQAMDNPAGKPRGSVMAVEYEVAGARFTAVNGGPRFAINPSISFFAEVASPEAANRLFGVLVEDGEVLMPLGAYPWSERYGWVADRFGVSWQVIALADGGAEPRIVPALMFCGSQHGNAEAAMRFYASVFPGGRVARLAHHPADADAALAGTVLEGRFVIAGQHMAAMDSGTAHGFGFNEAVSLQIMCTRQAEADRYWRELAAGGEQQMCGWLKDRFGVSWQVTPVETIDWLASDDAVARDRVFRAMLPMANLDIAALRRAFAG